jgi:3'-5' exoribonuclease
VKSLKKIADFLLNEEVEGHFMIKSVELKEARNKSKYLDIVLMDNSGTIETKLWDCSPTQIDWYKLRTVVFAKGLITEYAGNLQLKVEKMSVSEKDFDLNHFVPTVEEDIRELWQEIVDVVNEKTEISNWKIRHVLGELIDVYGDAFKEYPAARHMHHAVRGGLLFHTVSMLRIARSIVPLYPFLNQNLLFAGIILHDLAKIDEMKAEMGQVTDYTTSGQLLGHITLCINLIESVFQKEGWHEEEDTDLKHVLQHLVLSHHEKPEWGSPIAPMMPEAVMLSMIDQMDAKMYAAGKAIKKEVQTSYWTEPVKSFNNRKLYVWKEK